MSLPSERDPQLGNDADLRALFDQQRRGEHADAPAWRDEWLRTARPTGRASSHRRPWMAAGLVTACLAVAGALLTLLPLRETPAQPRLSEVLPPLFDAPSAELFADVGSAFTLLESPSDFLLPDHLH